MVNERRLVKCFEKAALVRRTLVGLEIRDALCVLGVTMSDLLDNIPVEERGEVMSDWLETLSFVTDNKQKRREGTDG
jgi:hypothetical protein